MGIIHRLISQRNSLPIYHTIGNHDIWGWFIKKDRPEDDPLYGKHWVIEKLAMPNRYYSFTKGRWTIIVLDSTQLNPAGGYIGKLDDEQLAWFQSTLAAVRQTNISAWFRTYPYWPFVRVYFLIRPKQTVICW